MRFQIIVSAKLLFYLLIKIFMINLISYSNKKKLYQLWKYSVMSRISL